MFQTIDRNKLVIAFNGRQTIAANKVTVEDIVFETTWRTLLKSHHRYYLRTFRR